MNVYVAVFMMNQISDSRRFYLLCSERVLAFAYAIVRSHAAFGPKDLAQDVMVNILKLDLFEKIRAKEENFNLEGYLYRAVQYRFFELLKKKANMTLPLEELALGYAKEFPVFEKEIDIEVLIREFMHEHPVHREKIEVFLKKVIEGKSGEAIAEEYNINPNLVYQWINRAKLHLSAYLMARGVTPDMI